MKRIWILLMLVLTTFALVACGPGETPPDNGGNNNGGGDNNGGNNNNGNNNNDDEKSDIDLNGDDFIIMVDNANSTDPRSENYERLFRDEKVAKINFVEKKYNVKVKFVNYPSNATWGGARERFVVEQSKMGIAPAHIFQVSSNSVATLATQGAIVPLDDLIEVYGEPGYWPEKLAFGKAKNNHYLYGDEYSVADDGLYYNSDLLAEVLGESRRYEPTEKWLDGEWDWNAFEALALELKQNLNHNRSEEEGGPQYVMGGRTYNWVYPMLGANGANLVTDDFETHLTEEPVLDILNFLNRLYEVDGMWIDNAPLENASQPQFTAGNVVFHNGQAWHINASNKWGSAKFQIDFVPYPKGPNIKEDMSNYSVTEVYGNSSYVISSSFDKANIPPGYENIVIHDETIFKIWQDLQYFPDIDPNTGLINLEPIKMDFYNVRLLPFYGSQVSILAHLSIFNLAKPDMFYSLLESQGHVEGSYMLKIQGAIRDGNVRTAMESLESELQAMLQEKFFPED